MLAGLNPALISSELAALLEGDAPFFPCSLPRCGLSAGSTSRPLLSVSASRPRLSTGGGDRSLI